MFNTSYPAATHEIQLCILCSHTLSTCRQQWDLLQPSFFWTSLAEKAQCSELPLGHHTLQHPPAAWWLCQTHSTVVVPVLVRYPEMGHRAPGAAPQPPNTRLQGASHYSLNNGCKYLIFFYHLLYFYAFDTTQTLQPPVYKTTQEHCFCTPLEDVCCSRGLSTCRAPRATTAPIKNSGKGHFTSLFL